MKAIKKKIKENTIYIRKKLCLEERKTQRNKAYI